MIEWSVALFRAWPGFLVFLWKIFYEGYTLLTDSLKIFMIPKCYYCAGAHSVFEDGRFLSIKNLGEDSLLTNFFNHTQHRDQDFLFGEFISEFS